MHRADRSLKASMRLRTSGVKLRVPGFPVDRLPGNLVSA